MVRASVAVSGNRRLPGQVLQLSIWQGAGMSCCHRGCSSLSSSPRPSSCSLWQLSQAWVPTRSFLSPSLLLGVCSRVKVSVPELQIYFLKHLWCLPPECVSKGSPCSECSSPSCGREQDRSGGNVRGWNASCSLQCRIGLGGWEEQGRDVQGLFRGWDRLFFRESSCHAAELDWGEKKGIRLESNVTFWVSKADWWSVILFLISNSLSAFKLHWLGLKTFFKTREMSVLMSEGWGQSVVLWACEPWQKSVLDKTLFLIVWEKVFFPSAVYRRHFITLQFDLEFVMKITEVLPLCTKLFGPDLATRPSVEEGDAK